MNEPHTESYFDKSSSLIELSPTSSSIFGHIIRSHFIIHQYLNLLNATEKSNVQDSVRLKLKMDVLYQKNAYHQYFPTLPPSVDARKDVPDIFSVRLKIKNALSFTPAEQLMKIHKNSYIKI